MAEAIPPIVWEPEEEEEEGGVLLTWEGWAELVLELVVLVLWGPEEVLEELEVWEEEATRGLRWDNREPSKDCSDRYGAERGDKAKKEMIRSTNHVTSPTMGFKITD